MKKLLNKPWFVALLAIAAIGAVWHTLAPYFSTPKPAAPIVADPAPSTGAPAGVEEPTASSVTDENGIPLIADLLKQVLPTKVARDPFAISVTTPSSQIQQQGESAPAEPDIVETVRLNALWTQNGGTLAFVNNEVHRAGDVIGRLKIESMGPRGIWLSHAKGQVFLEVGKSFALRTPARLAAKSPSQPTP